MPVRPPSVAAMHLTPEYAVPCLLGEGSKVTTLAQTNRDPQKIRTKITMLLERGLL